MSDWIDDPYFDDGSASSTPDSGYTSAGRLWHDVSPRWGHSMHAMCSYLGMFPARLAHYFVETYTKPGDVVVDPFSGRGTTALESRLGGRIAQSNDLSPLAYVLTHAKTFSPSWEQVATRIKEMEGGYSPSGASLNVPDEIRMLYHPNTLGQLVYLRERLFASPLSRWSATDTLIAASAAGILHGNHRSDGTSAYLSISMPNTFSMSPAYVRRYIDEHNLQAPEQNVFECLRKKAARSYADALPSPTAKSHSTHDDAGSFLSTTVRAGSADLVLTSPPYLRVVNYGTSNWIRLWWVGIDDVSTHAGVGRKVLDSVLDHTHSYADYRQFMSRTFRGIRRALKKSGVAAVVIGDVATPTKSTTELAEQVWQDAGKDSGLEMIDLIEDFLPSQSKVSRIWGDTKGRATERDCILLLSRADGNPREPNTRISWDESDYRDAGPDAVHEILR